MDEKLTDTWGATQARALWDNLYSRYSPVIDGQVILDLGCSWGYLLKLLSEEFSTRQLIGTDNHPLWDNRAHGWDYTRLGDAIRFYAGDLPGVAELQDESIDLILCSSVLQYMTPEQVESNLARAYDLLRPGGELILRTRVFTSYIGADLHRVIKLPYVHLLYPERDIERFVRDQGRKEPLRYLNYLTASTYVAMFTRVGFEALDVRRRMNKVEPLERVTKEFPWIAPEELLCAELEARLVRPIEAEELSRFAEMKKSSPVREGVPAANVTLPSAPTP
jgi:SAM-dependent methyltransferase